MSISRKKTSLKYVSNDKYKIIRKISSGSCGNVYLGKDMHNNQDVAIKIEKVMKKTYLHNEYNLYNKLSDSKGFPQVYYYEETENYKVLVMEILGPSLHELFEFCENRFSLKTSVMLAIQMLGRLELLHSKGYIHRDVKPSNFLIGADTANRNILYLVDLGLSTLYCDPCTQEHVPNDGVKHFCGTIIFSSVQSYIFGKQSRRDDLESVGYNIIYFLKGELPWQVIKRGNKFQQNEMVSEKKMSISLDELCIQIPNEIKIYLQYCRDLNYEDKPNYVFLETLLYNLLKRYNYEYDYFFDWSGLSPIVTLDKSTTMTTDKENVEF